MIWSSFKLRLYLLFLLSAFAMLVDSQKLISANSRADCVCYGLYKPVCASNGRTYQSACHLKCARKNENPYIMGLCKGECPCCKEPFFNEPLELENNGWGWGLFLQPPPPPLPPPPFRSPSRSK